MKEDMLKYIIPAIIGGGIVYLLMSRKKEVKVPTPVYPIPRIVKVPPTPEVAGRVIRVIKVTPKFYESVCKKLIVVPFTEWNVKKYTYTTPPIKIVNPSRYGIKVKVMGSVIANSDVLKLISKVITIRAGETKEVKLSVSGKPLEFYKKHKKGKLGIAIARPSTGKICLRKIVDITFVR